METAAQLGWARQLWRWALELTTPALGRKLQRLGLLHGKEAVGRRRGRRKRENGAALQRDAVTGFACSDGGTEDVAPALVRLSGGEEQQLAVLGFMVAAERDVAGFVID